MHVQMSLKQTNERKSKPSDKSLKLVHETYIMQWKTTGVEEDDGQFLNEGWDVIDGVVQTKVWLKSHHTKLEDQFVKNTSNVMSVTVVNEMNLHSYEQ